MQLIKDCLRFLLWLGILLLARLVLILVALADAVGFVCVTFWSVVRWDQTGHARWLWVPVAVLVMV